MSSRNIIDKDEKMRVCIIGDSNSNAHQIENNSLWNIKDLYWYPLLKLDLEILPIAFVRNNTKRILTMSDFFIKNANSDIFIIQIGVNDITSDFLNNDKIINKIYRFQRKTKMGKWLINYLYKSRKNKINSLEFENNLKKIINLIKKHNNVKKFIFLSIPYGIKEKNEYVIKYNTILNKISVENNGVFLDYFYDQEKDSSLIRDEIHYSKKLHDRISEKLIEIISTECDFKK